MRLEISTSNRSRCEKPMPDEPLWRAINTTGVHAPLAVSSLTVYLECSRAKEQERKKKVGKRRKKFRPTVRVSLCGHPAIIRPRCHLFPFPLILCLSRCFYALLFFISRRDHFERRKETWHFRRAVSTPLKDGTRRPTIYMYIYIYVCTAHIQRREI